MKSTTTKEKELSIEEVEKLVMKAVNEPAVSYRIDWKYLNGKVCGCIVTQIVDSTEYPKFVDYDRQH